MNKQKGILVLSPFFSPNIGGVETHLDDLVREIDGVSYRSYVHTYSPITTPNTTWKSFEKRGERIEIFRYGWFGKNLFHNLEKYPLLDFLYLTPYLLIRVAFWMIFNQKKIDTIHAHGFNGAFIGVVLKKIFNKKTILSTHTIYQINQKALLAKVLKTILNQLDLIMCLSSMSLRELESFGVKAEKLSLYRYWIDLDVFKENCKPNNNKIKAIFISRLLDKKGVNLILETAKKILDINFIFIGTGPESINVINATKQFSNIVYLGKKNKQEIGKLLPNADVFLLPSTEIEGTPISIMESLACGVPVITTSQGGIPDIVDESVSIMISPKSKSLTEVLLKIRGKRNILKKLKKNCRKYAKSNFSKRNFLQIFKHY